jgi:hypothetical protein
LKVRDEPAASFYLARRRRGLIEIADQANAQPLFIIFRVPGWMRVRTVFLLQPSTAHFDFAVATLSSVANDKVVAAFIPTTFRPAMEPIDTRISAVLLAAVMQHDVLPMAYRDWRIN